MNHKKVYIDFYHSLYEDDGLTTKELVHLNSMDINTDIDIGNVVEQLKLLIFKQYGDGLFIQAEEFENLCYINIIIMFGEDHNLLAEYLGTIHRSEEVKVNKITAPSQGNFLSVDYFFNQEETKDLRRLLNNLGIESKVYFIERKAFERGAGDYHENVILSFLAGSAEAIGNRVTNLLMDKFGNHNPRLTNFNTDNILSHISEETGINKQDLHLTKIENISNGRTEINITNRYKSIKVIYDKDAKSINYEVMDKTQTMI
ncbi:hypothetical protein [Bacillus sp. 1P02SD]|uniref:hypothetical protein n=1 Tax=Bacillus sp. 1P02SD TaxID=3132264 RepID=UPI0039A26551